jgi:hypothetical protein
MTLYYTCEARNRAGEIRPMLITTGHTGTTTQQWQHVIGSGTGMP